MTMAKQRLTLQILHARAQARRFTATEAEASIVWREGDRVECDTSHPGYPGKARDGEPARGELRPLLPPVTWPELDAWASGFAGTSDEGAAHMLSQRDRLPITCGCADHWTRHIKANPPPTPEGGSMWRWVQEARAAIARRVGKPAFSIEQAAAAQGIDPATGKPDPSAQHVYNSATGLGDAISGLYAVCGLADATGRPVIYHAHSAAWLARVSHPNVYIVPKEYGQHGADLNNGEWSYVKQVQQAPTRTGAYCANLAHALRLPAFTPTRPASIDLTRANKYPGRNAVLAPFSCYSSREWPAAKWCALAGQLVAEGYHVHAIGSAQQAGQLADALGDATVTRHVGLAPAHVINLMLAAEVVVANDSGPAHVGGLLGVPTICVHAGSLPHGFLFDLAPSVVSITGVSPVSRSDHSPHTLARIQVDAVTAAIAGKGTAAAVVEVAVPIDQWPEPAKYIYGFRQPGETGLGDTIAAQLPTADRTFRRAMSRLRISCACDIRQKQFNERFAYTIGCEPIVPQPAASHVG
jgi:ADP-heptose:LPS heptosyltransferase